MNRIAATVVALSLAAVACGARTDLDAGSSAPSGGGGSGGGAAPACAPPPPAPGGPCTAWKVAGADRVISPMPPVDGSLELGAVVRGECGAIVAWSTLSGSPQPETLSWSTRWVAFDGAPLAGVREHPGLNTSTNASGAIALANNGGRLAAVAFDVSGCKFVSLDESGADAGSVVSLGHIGCTGLAASGSGFSFLRPTLQFGTPVTLVDVDPNGTILSQTKLPIAGKRALWDRLEYDDGSFLVNTFAEDAETVVYTTWLQRFDAQGAALGGEVTFGHDAPLLLAKTPDGALAGWEAAGSDSQWIDVAPIDRNGAMTGAFTALHKEPANYGATLASAPDGDVMLTRLDLPTSSEWEVSVQALGPDGVPRGPATPVLEDVQANRVEGLIEAHGARAMLVFENGGIHTLPLECVR